MRYLCSGDFGTPVLGADYEHKSEALALRHARAMLEVQRASKAWKKASERLCKASVRDFPAVDVAYVDADARLIKAVARLERIEKEVHNA